MIFFIMFYLYQCKKIGLIFVEDPTVFFESHEREKYLIVKETAIEGCDINLYVVE